MSSGSQGNGKSSRSGFYPALIGREVEVEQGAGVLLVGKEVEVESGAAALVVAGEAEVEEGAAVVVVAGKAEVEDSFVGILISGRTKLEDGSRVLITGKHLFFGGLAWLLYSLLREDPPRRRKLFGRH